MVEWCSVTVLQIGGFGPDSWEHGEQPLPHEQAPVPTVSMLAAPALSLSGPQPPFSLYSVGFPPPHLLQSLPAASFRFPSHLRSQLCSHRSPKIEAMQCIFSKNMVPQLWTHSSIQVIFLRTGKSCLVAALVRDVLIMQPLVNLVLSTLWSYSAHKFSTLESQEWAVTVQIIWLLSPSTLTWQSYTVGGTAEAADSSQRLEEIRAPYPSSLRNKSKNNC